METNAKDVRRRKREPFMHFIRRRRKASGYSQTSLAKALRLKSPSTVSLWESGKSFPSDELIPDLASLLGLEALELTDLIEAEQKKRDCHELAAH